MKNNRGFLLAEETLKIIIAVICIGFLAYFLTSVYMKSKTDENLEFARASLEHLIKEADSMKNGEVRNVEIWNPKDWVIVSWPYNGIIPNSCSNLGWESCICISKDVNLGDQLLSALPFTKSVSAKFKEKSDKGVCLDNPHKFVVKIGNNQQPISISPPLQLKIENRVISKK